MSVDDETEMRDIIAKNLEKNGVVGRIKAELRASVFLALEEEGCLKDRIPIVNKPLMKFIDTPRGKAVTSMVREFLEFFNMKFTMSVFDPESSNPNLFSREELCDKFNLKYVSDNEPILMHFLNIDEASGDHVHVGEVSTARPSTTSAKYNNEELVKKNLSKESSPSNLQNARSNISMNKFKSLEKYSNLQFPEDSVPESDIIDFNFPKTFSSEGDSSDSSSASFRDLSALDIGSGNRHKKNFSFLPKLTIPVHSKVTKDHDSVSGTSKNYGV